MLCVKLPLDAGLINTFLDKWQTTPNDR